MNTAASVATRIEALSTRPGSSGWGRDDVDPKGRIRGAAGPQPEVACFSISVILYYYTMKVHYFRNLLNRASKDAITGLLRGLRGVC